MNLKIVSEGSGKIVSLSNLSRHLSTNSDIYLLEEDKEILLGFVNHSLIVYFAVEFADYAIQNYEKKKNPEAEECFSLVRKWIENPSSVSKEELEAATANAYSASNAANTATYAATYAATAAANAATATYTASAAKEFERQGRFILDCFHSNAWLFKL